MIIGSSANRLVTSVGPSVLALALVICACHRKDDASGIKDDTTTAAPVATATPPTSDATALPVASDPAAGTAKVTVKIRQGTRIFSTVAFAPVAVGPGYQLNVSGNGATFDGRTLHVPVSNSVVNLGFSPKGATNDAVSGSSTPLDAGDYQVTVVANGTVVDADDAGLFHFDGLDGPGNDG